jgi:hypothetical protein
MRGRRKFLIGTAVWACAGAAYAADPKLGEILGSAITGGRGPGLSEADASGGIKQALTNGVIAATARLGKVDGFFADAKAHIPLPGPLGKARKTLKPLGMSRPFDELELKMNRAAEAAMPTAKTLFLRAVRTMTISDAIAIVRGGDTAGADYLRQRTEPDLTALLRPTMTTTLQTTGAFAALDRASAGLGAAGAMLGGGANIGSDLKKEVIDFAVKKTLDGAFGYIGEEERSIRRDPLKRTSSLLKQVFGG